MNEKLIFSIVVAIFCLIYNLTIVDAIQSGRFVSINEASFFAHLVYDDYPSYCGGAILSKYWIITAAHCIGVKNVKHLSVGIGRNMPYKLGKPIYEIEKIFIPGSYDNWKSYDMALIKLKSPISFNEYQQPIKLSNKDPEKGDIASVYGLGFMNLKQEFSPVLKRGDVEVFTNDECLAIDNVQQDKRGWFCAGNGTEDHCGGDSGGPAVINGMLAGTVVAGYGCEMIEHVKNSPGEYTNIKYSYDWIIKITGIKY